MKYGKKGQVDSSISTIITLIVGVGIAVLLLIFIGILGGKAYTVSESDINEIGNTSVTGDIFTVIESQNTYLGVPYIHTGTLVIYNNTAPHTKFNLNNFSINYDTGYISTANASGNGGNPQNNTVLAANYSYGDITIQNGIKGSIRSGFSALEDTGGYLPLIILGIVIFIILTLILGFTSFGGNQGGGMAL